MMYAFYPGCLSQVEQFSCLSSTREVLTKLGVRLQTMDGSSCCGYPTYRLSSPVTWSYLTARNLALAERLGLDVLTSCNDCYLSFRKVTRAMEDDPRLRETVNDALKLEGLEYGARAETYHVVEVLHDKIGVKGISEAVVKPFKNLRLATQPGCHLFRPGDLPTPDESEPHKLDDLVRALGAETFDYPHKLDCCGSMMYAPDPKASLRVVGKKLESVKEAGFDGLVTICPHCFRMLDTMQGSVDNALGNGGVRVPVFHYAQLLGLAMGLSPARLGLQFNSSPVRGLVDRM
ncbi:MAG TPA: CoB--CoM heterodisulfide reductase iron-sulfur subunit B family protein [Candidatus Bathyarchaeia archaeon]